MYSFQRKKKWFEYRCNFYDLNLYTPLNLSVRFIVTLMIE